MATFLVTFLEKNIWDFSGIFGHNWNWILTNTTKETLHKIFLVSFFNPKFVSMLGYRMSTLGASIWKNVFQINTKSYPLQFAELFQIKTKWWPLQFPGIFQIKSQNKKVTPSISGIFQINTKKWPLQFPGIFHIKTKNDSFNLPEYFKSSNQKKKLPL